jgi:DNA-binding response OmpR family regulator
METKTVLTVDDDPAMRRLLRNCLESDGYVVVEAQTKEQVHERLKELHVDLITLDVNLGAESGFDIARSVRGVSQVPIIMVTGRDDVIDRIVGLEIGADDYITKPFHLREVLARVRSVLRRSSPSIPGGNAAQPEKGTVPHDPEPCFAFDGLLADPNRMELLDRDGNVCDLTSGDFGLLLVLLKHPKRVLPRETIMDLLKGIDWAPLDRTIDNQVARLRKKIEREPAQPKLIKTVRGVGYLFAADIERHACDNWGRRAVVKAF